MLKKKAALKAKAKAKAAAAAAATAAATKATKATAAAVTAIVPVDPNRNAERAAAKLEWANFANALARLPPEHDVTKTYAELSRQQKAEFRKKWAVDPEWDFVRMFKRRVVTQLRIDDVQACASLLQI